MVRNDMVRNLYEDRVRYGYYMRTWSDNKKKLYGTWSDKWFSPEFELASSAKYMDLGLTGLILQS